MSERGTERERDVMREGCGKRERERGRRGEMRECEENRGGEGREERAGGKKWQRGFNTTKRIRPSHLDRRKRDVCERVLKV